MIQVWVSVDLSASADPPHPPSSVRWTRVRLNAKTPAERDSRASKASATRPSHAGGAPWPPPRRSRMPPIRAHAHGLPQPRLVGQVPGEGAGHPAANVIKDPSGLGEIEHRLLHLGPRRIGV